MLRARFWLPLILLAALPFASPHLAHSQNIVDCAPNVPCTTSGPSGTNTGDAAWLAFGKINSNFNQQVIPPNTLLGNCTVATAFATACNALPVMDASAATVLATGSSAARSLAARGGDEANVADFGAPSDTVHILSLIHI